MRSRTVFAFAALITSFAAPISAQAPEDPGPHLVGWRDVSFEHDLAATSPVMARVFYPAVSTGSSAPADPANGPYPVVALIHGAGTFPFDYDLVGNHLASWGFIVAAVGTIGNFTSTVPEDTRALLHWTDEQKSEASSFLFNMASSDPWSVIGHSSGAISAYAATEIESNIETLVVTEPSFMTATAVDNFSGDVLIIGATDDIVTPPATHALEYLDDTDLAPRRIYIEVQGGGHYGVVDIPFGPVPPLSQTEQHRMHRRAMGSFLRAEVMGQESVYQALLGNGATGEPITSESQSTDTMQWLGEGAAPGDFTWGLARARNQFGLWLAASGTATVPTIYGDLGLDPLSLIVGWTEVLGANGVAEITVPIGPALNGQSFFFQTIAVGVSDGAFSETVEFTLP